MLGHDLFHLHRRNVRVHRVSETAEIRTRNEPGPGRQTSAERDTPLTLFPRPIKPAADAGGTGPQKRGPPRGVWVNSATRFSRVCTSKRQGEIITWSPNRGHLPESSWARTRQPGCGRLAGDLQLGCAEGNNPCVKNKTRWLPERQRSASLSLRVHEKVTKSKLPL